MTPFFQCFLIMQHIIYDYIYVMNFSVSFLNILFHLRLSGYLLCTVHCAIHEPFNPSHHTQWHGTTGIQPIITRYVTLNYTNAVWSQLMFCTKSVASGWHQMHKIAIKFEIMEQWLYNFYDVSIISDFIVIPVLLTSHAWSSSSCAEENDS